MGLYDRDYGREYGEETPWEQQQRAQAKPRSSAIILLVITVGVFFLDLFLSKPAAPSKIAEWFAVRHDTLTEPWTWWQFLSYGFVHDHRGIGHILFNMIGLFFFGRAVEQQLGFYEFLRFYLVAIFIGGVVGTIGFQIAGVPGGSVIGASGAVIASTILFACYHPQATILLMFVIPVKAWVVAVMFIAADLYGALGGSIPGSGNTAFAVHLSGAGFALLYYFQRWNLRWLSFGFLSDAPGRLRQRTRRAKLKLHDPDKKLKQEAQEADRILAKIHDQGEESLTRAERRTLQRYSRRQREKRNQ